MAPSGHSFGTKVPEHTQRQEAHLGREPGVLNTPLKAPVSIAGMNFVLLLVLNQFTTLWVRSGVFLTCFPPKRITSRLKPSVSPCHDHQLVHVSTFSITIWRGGGGQQVWWGTRCSWRDCPSGRGGRTSCTTPLICGVPGAERLFPGVSRAFSSVALGVFGGQPADVTSVLHRLPALLHPTLRASRQRHPAPLHRGGREHPEVQPAL